MTELAQAIENFICSGCGKCCSNLHISVANIKKLSQDYNIPFEELEFPYSYDETGRCEMLDSDNTCKVYNNRPNICNIDYLQKRLNKNKHEFYEENYRYCKILKDNNE